MLKKKSKILLVALLVILSLTSVCFATEDVASTENTAVVTSETNNEQAVDTTTSTANWVNTDLYLAEDKVTIDTVVDGNAFVAAKEVTVTGEIGGDLFVVANKLNIEGGYVYSSIFACANEITINGVVYDVYAVCNNFNLESNGFVYRDLKITGANITLNGKIRRDAYISANSLNLNEQSGTIIYGNLKYSTPSEVTIPEGAVSGTVKYSAKSVDTEKETNVATIILSYVFELLKSLFATFILVLILLWLTPKFVNRVGNMSTGKSFACLGIGIVSPIALIIVCFLLSVSVIGAKLLLPTILMFAGLSFIAYSVVSIFFGKLFTKLLKMDSKVKFILFTLLSNLVLWGLTKIPVAGGYIQLLIWLFGIGIILVNIVCRKEVIVEKAEKAQKDELKTVEAKVEKEPKATKAKVTKTTSTAKTAKTTKSTKTTKTKKEDK